jgi:hypothetical protein
MQLEIRADPRFKRPFSLKFGLMEFTDDEKNARRTTLLVNVGLFALVMGLAFGIGAFIG